MSNEEHSPKISLYERTRDERIKENLDRMQKLGLKQLSLKLKPLQTTPRNKPSTPKLTTPLFPSAPIRRSSRLQNSTPVSYSEAALSKKEELLVDTEVVLKEGPKQEVYTEEHEKLLGSTERSWTLFVDGCGHDGKRIYDPIKGKTCHQCRQKTMGYRTHCSKCDMVQGQFCGDCLYMRYGEHVIEANENPNWVCPVCRGICNCSLCRNAKGWAPTGTLYKKISSLGYKSVAHYLIQTRRSQTNVGMESDTVNQVSARRPLLFKDNDAPSEKLPQINGNQSKPVKSEPVDEASNVSEAESKEEMPRSGSSTDEDHVTTPLPMSISSIESRSVLYGNRIGTDLDLSRTETENTTGQQLKVDEVNELAFNGEEKHELVMEQIQGYDAEFGVTLTHTHSNTEHSSIQEVTKEGEMCTETHSNGQFGVDETQTHSNADQFSIQELEKENEMCSETQLYAQLGLIETEIHSNVEQSVKEVKIETEMVVEDDKQACNSTALDGSRNLKKKRSSAEADDDSIGARLRQRRRVCKVQENGKLGDTKEPTTDVKEAAKSISASISDRVIRNLRGRSKTT